MGLFSSTFGHLQIGASRSGCLNVIRTTLIDANVSDRVASLSDALVDSLRSAFATPATVAA